MKTSEGVDRDSGQPFFHVTSAGSVTGNAGLVTDDVAKSSTWWSLSLSKRHLIK